MVPQEFKVCTNFTYTTKDREWSRIYLEETYVCNLASFSESGYDKNWFCRQFYEQSD